MGLLSDIERGRYKKVARGLLGPAYEPAASLLPLAGEFSPGADFRDYADYSGQVGSDIQKGNYGQAAMNAGNAAASLAAILLPGSVSGGKKVTDELVSLSDEIASKMSHEDRLKIAQHNAAVPKEQGGLGLAPDNTQSERAEAMGFKRNMPLYHGTNSDISEFSTDHYGKNVNSRVSKQGVSASLDPSVADEFSGLRPSDGSAGPNTLPLLHRFSDGVRIELPNSQDQVLDKEVYRAVSEAFDDLSKDAILMENYTTPGGKTGVKNVLVKNPNQLRALFAAFDPARKNSANLLAGMAGVAATPLLYGILNHQERDY